MISSQLMHAGKIALALFIMLSFSRFSYSQKPDRKETISYINQKLAPLYSVSMKGGTLIVTGTDKNGKKVREDKVAAFDLDTVAIYEPEEKMLSVNCVKDSKNCVTRTLYIHKTKKQYNRVSFAVDLNDAELEGLRKALIHLIRIDSQFRYADEISFE